MTNACLRCGSSIATAEHGGLCDPCLLASMLDDGEPAISAAEEKAGDTIGNYVLEEPIGEGGMGRVWRAQQTEPLQRMVALKIVKLGMDTRGVVKRFEAERQTLAVLNHPNIASVFDAGATDTGRPYFVMEMVEGEPVTDFARKRSLALGERLDLFRQICTAVSHAHANGVIHRDIKPNNVLVAQPDTGEKPTLKVIDFGISKAIAPDFLEQSMFTQQGQIVGTPGYMSPEQAGAAPDIDARTDVYSLGALLYELLVDAPPHSKQTLRDAGFAEIMRVIREDDPPKPSRISPRAPHQQVLRSHLDEVVMKALSRDRDKRYGTVADLSSAIGSFLDGKAGEGGTASGIGRAWAMAALAVALAVAVIWKFWPSPTLPAGSAPTVSAEVGGTVITSSADSGPGSLRELIARSPSGATLTFAPELAGKTIFLKESLVIEKRIALDASKLEPKLILDAGGQSRVARVLRGARLRADSLKFTGGKVDGGDGGAILNEGELSLSYCEFENNAATAGGAISNDEGRGGLDHCIFRNNTADHEGGAVYVPEGGELRILFCRFEGNFASSGGAISCLEDVTLEIFRSLFLKNNASDVGGAIYSGELSTAKIALCHFTSNKSEHGGNAIDSDGDLSLLHCTVIGSIHGDLCLDNCIATGGIEGSIEGGENFLSGDPQLEGLGDFGGWLPTMPPRPGSPVIDRGVPTALTLDARNLPFVGKPDLGATEFQQDR